MGIEWGYDGVHEEIHGIFGIYGMYMEYIYIYISKCHMKQILSRAPAAFFFHSYAYAQSISPAILRFALGCHDVTRT